MKETHQTHQTQEAAVGVACAMVVNVMGLVETLDNVLHNYEVNGSRRDMLREAKRLLERAEQFLQIGDTDDYDSICRFVAVEAVGYRKVSGDHTVEDLQQRFCRGYDRYLSLDGDYLATGQD